MSDFAWPLPAPVIADILGVPRVDPPMLKRWSDDIAEFVLVSRVNPEKYALAAASLGTRGNERASNAHAAMSTTCPCVPATPHRVPT